MPIDRRAILTTGLISAGAAATATPVAARTQRASSATETGLVLRPRRGRAQSRVLQSALDESAKSGRPVHLTAGTFRVSGVRIPAGAQLIGVGAQTVLEYNGSDDVFFSAHEGHSIRLSRLTLDGASFPLNANRSLGLLDLRDCSNVVLDELEVRNGLLNGISLDRVSGRVSGCRIHKMGQAAIFSVDAAGLTISDCHLADLANNGIQIWRQSPGHDGTLITSNRIEQVSARGGGSGQNGNGVNVYRANGVVISGNQIHDCAYSAIRGNSASNIQMLGNSCGGIGEVALYAEFSFEGAVIANNIVDGAASGISVTNFNDGGRLAVVQGNLVRNMKTRAHEPVDKRGDGISVEADAAVSGNVVENAPGIGIAVGWGPHMRNASVTGNVIRDAGIGIGVSATPGVGACLISQNIIARARKGGIFAMDHGKPISGDLGGTAGLGEASASSSAPTQISVMANVVSSS